MKVYQDVSGAWRVGDGHSQASQVFPSEEAALKFVERRLSSQASWDRMMNYPGKIIPVEWLKENAAQQSVNTDAPMWRCHHCGEANSHDNANCSACGKSGRR